MAKLAPLPPDPTHVENLLRLTRAAPGGCLLWTAGANVSGRPIFHYKDQSLSVGRHIYIAVHGPLKNPRWVVEPKCGNLRCVAPEHLTMVPHSRATKRLVGVPLPKGETLVTAGYVLVHRPRGASIWEPLDIAKAVWAARGEHVCYVCDAYIERAGKIVCSPKCANARSAAKKRQAEGRARPGDEHFRLEVGDARPKLI